MSTNTDIKPGSEPVATSGIAESNLTTAKKLRQKSLEQLNIQPGEKTTKDGKYVYLTAPKILPRLFGPPVPAPGGDPFKIYVSQGWGAARPVRNKQGIDIKGATRGHAGLDFPGAVGTPVFAAYSGFVSFVGVQTRSSTKRVKGPVANDIDNRVNPAKQINGGGDIYDSDGQLAVAINDIGFGGIAVNIKHDGEFSGYETQSYHLKQAIVANNSYVNEGDIIGYMGLTGGNNGIVVSGSHLHWQILYKGVIVKPEGLVPSTKFSEANTGYNSAIIQYYNEAVPRGQAIAVDSAVNASKNADRSINAANQKRSEILSRGAKHFNYMSNLFTGSASLVYQSTAAFLESGTEVSGPMVFNFDTGLWSDGEPV